jgi:hypothetical protein
MDTPQPYRPDELAQTIAPDDPRYPELAGLALARLRGGADRDDVVRAVAERGAVAWHAAEQLVAEVEQRHGRSIGFSQRVLGFLLALLVVGGSLTIAGLLVATAIFSPPTITPRTGHTSDAVAALLTFGPGIFFISASLFDWDWFYELRKVRSFVDLFGRRNARIFYFAFGAILLGYSAYLARIG